MRVAFLCKRRYMGKDVIDDRYARLYEIPRQLARSGHEVHAFCLAYARDSAEGNWVHDAAPGSLRWYSRTRSRFWVGTVASYPLQLLYRLRALNPDVIVAASDIPHVAWGAWLAHMLSRPLVVDLYDNFESFGQARLPLAKSMLRRATAKADLVLATSQPLADMVRETYRPRGQVVALPSTVDVRHFKRGDKRSARHALGLPEDALLIGTAGGLTVEKGIDTLYAAWERIRALRPDIHLVLAGPHDSDFPPPQDASCHYLGRLGHAQVPTLFQALDVGAICIKDSLFGRYCFPQKAYEMIACGLPVVAARVGAMTDLLSEQPDTLYTPSDPDDLACKLIKQATAATPTAVKVRDWSEVLGEVTRTIERLAAG